MKPSICKVCKAEFVKQKMGQKVCGPECALSLAVSNRGHVDLSFRYPWFIPVVGFWGVR